MASTYDHPHSGAGPREDSDPDPDDSDTGSVLCDDSLLPNIERRDKPPQTLYEACAANDTVSLQSILEKGVSKDQAMHLDINGRSGLMVAVSKGFVDVVSTLHVCPLIDVNHQDNDGNSALMIAAQAGFTTILNFILNHYSGVDTELRDPRGFTALMKAGLQGREECVSALLMHGADMNARDHVQAGALKDWVLKTGRFETLSRIRRLQARPVAEQFCERYAPEWPQLRELVAKATGSKSTSRKLRQIIKKNLTFSFPHDPQNNGVMDHMVRMTTGIRSPLVATACHPLCPSSPPQIGKRRFALPERLEEHSSAKLEEHAVSHSKGPLASAASVQLSSRCQEAERGESAPPGAARSFIPRSVARRNSIFPTRCVPKIEVTKSGEPTPKTEKKNQQNGYLELPVWRYKEKKKREKQKEMQQEKISEGSENIDKT